MPTGAQVVAQARRLTGFTYRFGGELDPYGPPGDCDCSELVEWAVAQAGAADGTMVRIVDGSFNQYAACHPIPLSQAFQTMGALVFLSKTDPPEPGRDGIYHVGIVDPDAGEIVEACCGDGDTIRPSTIGARNWFHTGGLIPGINYGIPAPTFRPEDHMLVIEPTGGSVALLHGGRLVWLRDPDTLPAIAEVLGPPAPIDPATWAGLIDAYGEPS